jgi:hypothetical protein
MVIPALLSSAKFYVGLGVVVAVAALFWRLDHLTTENQRLRTNVELAQWAASESNRLLEVERKELAAANTRRAEHLAKIEEVERENQKYQSCVAAGTCGVRIVRATCPKVPRPTTGATGAGEGAPELDAALQQDILNLRAGIRRLEADFNWCQRELIERSAR